VDSAADKVLAGEPIVRSGADTAVGVGFQLETRAGAAPRFTFIGPRCQALNGVSAETVIADAATLFDLLVPEHRDTLLSVIADAAAARRAFDVEVAMRLDGGEVSWRRFAARPRAEEDGRILWEGLEIDTSERRRMEAELAEQRWRLEMAAEATGLGFWEWDVAAGSVVWSGRNRELFGLTPDEEVTVPRYMELVHADDRDKVREAFAAARDTPSGGDYSLEHRIVTPAGVTRWILTNGRVIPGDDGEARLVVGTSLDVTERKAAEERRSLLLGELAHRAKNGISVMMAIVAQTARGQETVEGFQDVLMARLQAMATSQDLVTAARGQPVPLTDVIGKAIAPFGERRFDLDPALADLTLRGDMAAGMGLLLHEMATNAVKYGALSNEKGRVKVAAERASDGRAAFRWREVGGPKVALSGRRGFGSRLLEQVLRPQGGDVKFGFEPKGFHACVEFPVVRVASL
jgi:PAS domain S-box-containing protein